MHAGHVSNDLYNKSNIRDLTNFMVKEPIAETDVLQCNLRKIRYIFCLIRVRNFLTNRDVFLRLAPLNFGKYIKYWHKWRKLLVFHIIVATIKHMLLDHACTVAECLIFMFNVASLTVLLIIWFNISSGTTSEVKFQESLFKRSNELKIS